MDVHEAEPAAAKAVDRRRSGAVLEDGVRAQRVDDEEDDVGAVRRLGEGRRVDRRGDRGARSGLHEATTCEVPGQAPTIAQRWTGRLAARKGPVMGGAERVERLVENGAGALRIDG